jgi:predicted secreted protein
MAKEGYVNGSDLLMSIAGKACGHCTSHTATYNSETKDRAVKPASTESAANAGLFKEKTVTGLSVQVKCEGLRFYGEEENGMKELLAKWKVGGTVELKGFVRGSDAAPYMNGNFIISSLEEAAPAGDDTTYNATFDNTGVVTIDEAKVDGTVAEG